jgi:hypothetical protein
MASLTPNPHISAVKCFRADLSFEILAFQSEANPAPSISLADLMCCLHLSNLFLRVFCRGLSTAAEVVAAIVCSAQPVI